ncbi:MAG: DUF4339 domain-containing protein [Akkermansiaceae bacterium]
MAKLSDTNRTYKSPLGQPKALWWFYEDKDGKAYGPMPFRELRENAIKRTLVEDMKVWREGEEERYASQDIVGLLPTGSSQAKIDPGPQSSMDDDNPYASPNAERIIADGPPGGLYLPHLNRTHFSILLCFIVTALGFGTLSAAVSDPLTRSIIYSFSALALCGWVLFSLLYLRRAWNMMNMLGASMNGTKAVLVFLIPFFNVLWSFVAIFGWAKLWNFNAENHPGLSEAKSVWKLIFFLFCVGFLMTHVIVLMLWTSGEVPRDILNPRHQFALGTFAVTFLLCIATWYQLCRSVNFLARKKS